MRRPARTGHARTPSPTSPASWASPARPPGQAPAATNRRRIMTTAGDPSVLAVAFLIARVRQRARRRAARSWLDDVPGPAAAAVRALAATRAEWEPASELQAARASGKQ